MDLAETFDIILTRVHDEAVAMDGRLFLADGDMPDEGSARIDRIDLGKMVFVIAEDIDDLYTVVAGGPEFHMTHLRPGLKTQQDTTHDTGYNTTWLHPYLLTGFDALESASGDISGPLLSFLPKTEIFT